MKSKTALITGIGGQDGSYLAELLVSRGYSVHGIVRRESFENNNHLTNLFSIIDRITVHPVSVDNHLGVYRLIKNIQPDECYHLAASSFVSYEMDDEITVISNNFNSTHYLLSSIKELAPACRFYFAGSSEMFGDATESPQFESTSFQPRSIYGISKVSSYHLVSNYRRHKNLFACSGILYNHESPRRGREFVTRKITSSVARISAGLQDRLVLGNLEAKRDWGYAPEYVNAMWAMLNQDLPDDYVIATGHLHTVREFVECAFNVVNLDYRDYVETSSSYYRPDEKVPLTGDSTKARLKFHWKPQTDFQSLVETMVLGDIEALEKKHQGAAVFA